MPNNFLCRSSLPWIGAKLLPPFAIRSWYSFICIPDILRQSNTDNDNPKIDRVIMVHTVLIAAVSYSKRHSVVWVGCLRLWVGHFPNISRNAPKWPCLSQPFLRKSCSLPSRGGGVLRESEKTRANSRRSAGLTDLIVKLGETAYELGHRSPVSNRMRTTPADKLWIAKGSGRGFLRPLAFDLNNLALLPPQANHWRTRLQSFVYEFFTKWLCSLSVVCTTNRNSLIRFLAVIAKIDKKEQNIHKPKPTELVCLFVFLFSIFSHPNSA